MPQPHSGRREDGFRPHKNKTLTLKNPKPKRWSHQDELDAAIGKTIELHLNGGSVVDGELIAADQFTVKVKRGGISGPPFFVVYNKSSLTSFQVMA